MCEISPKTLIENLSQFTGTSQYYRISRTTLLTDGAYFLAEHAGAFWLMLAFASYLNQLNPDDWFAVLKLHVIESSALLRLEDGNDNLIASQQIEYTDFPLSNIVLYACWDSENWVLMLPSEY